MGKLRTEPKIKSSINEEKYRHFLEILESAKSADENSTSYYDLDDDENHSQVRKEIIFVANKEGFNLEVRRIRGSNSLSLTFKEHKKHTAERISAEDSSNRILNTLMSAKLPLQKQEILQQTGISPSTWNIRIKKLLEEGKVLRTGHRRDTKYVLPKS